MAAGVSAQSQTKGQTKKTSEGTITTPNKDQPKGNTNTSVTRKSIKKKNNFPKDGVRSTRSKAVSKKPQVKSEISSPK